MPALKKLLSILILIFILNSRRGQYCILEKTENKILHNHIIF